MTTGGSGGGSAIVGGTLIGGAILAEEIGVLDGSKDSFNEWLTTGRDGVLIKSDDGSSNDEPEINNPVTSSGSIAAGGAPGLPPDDDDGNKNDSDKKPDIKMANDSYLKRNGFDAHKIKEEFFGRGSNSKYDIYIDKKSGELMLFRKGGLGDGVRTGYFIK